MVRRSGYLLLCFLVLAILWGCGENGGNGGTPSDPATERSAPALAPYPAGLSAESSPTDVATVLIAALDSEDKATLLGLVAVEHEVEAVDAIYRRHGRASRLKPENVAAMTAAGWQATYAFFKKNETKVERETVTGDKAEVFAAGKSPLDKPCGLKIKLVREGGVWKVRAGLESLPE